MHPLPFVYPYALIFWPVYGVMFAQEMKVMGRRKPKSSEVRDQDRGSCALVLTCNGIAVALAFTFAWTIPSALLGIGQLACFWCGVLLMFCGFLLRGHCFRTLAIHFNPVVTVVSNQPVIERGAYKWIRHPSYLAGLFMFGGIGIALANWFSILASVVLPMIAYVYRIRVEERALVETIGTPYREYMKRTKRLIPFLI